MVEIYNNLFPHMSLHKDLHTHTTHCMQIILNSALGYEKCFVSKAYYNIQLIYLFWFKIEQTLPGFGVTCFTSASTSASFLSRFPGSCATWLRQCLNSKSLSTAHKGKSNRGRPRNLQRRKVEVTRWQK